MSTTTTKIPGLTLRHATAADWDAMADALNRASRADGIGEVRTRAELAAQYAESARFQLERDVLVAEIDATLVGFSFGYRVVRDDTLVAESWGAVVPEHRRHGIGTMLFRANRERLFAECAADPRPGPREMRSFALDQEGGLRAQLANEGFVTIRYGFEMRRYLTAGLPDHLLPSGLEMRPVTTDQHRAIFDGEAEAFEDHWGHRPPEESDFQAWFHGPAVDTSLWCVAWDGDEVAGVVMNTIIRAENEALGIRRGWLDHVSVRRQWRRRGVARALCAASLRVLREQGMDEAWLGVDGSNPTGAVRLYEGLGFGVVRRWQVYGRPLEGRAPAGWQPAGRSGEG
jgi:ribosomal protein S18 acetylase RimI-like enzyme